MTDMVELIDRAARDPEFLRGIVPSDQLKAALGMSSERQIAETLQARIAHIHGKQ